jgi:hypothetical protein
MPSVSAGRSGSHHRSGVARVARYHLADDGSRAATDRPAKAYGGRGCSSFLHGHARPNASSASGKKLSCSRSGCCDPHKPGRAASSATRSGVSLSSAVVRVSPSVRWAYERAADLPADGASIRLLGQCDNSDRRGTLHWNSNPPNQKRLIRGTPSLSQQSTSPPGRRHEVHHRVAC